MLRLLTGMPSSGKTETVLREIRRRGGRFGFDVLIVPEQHSHEMERRLAETCGAGAGMYAEVLSFSRLADRVLAETGGLSELVPDKGGRLLLMLSALDMAGSELKSYGSFRRRPEFLERLVDAVTELKTCRIDSGSLTEAAERTDGALSEKLHDLALLSEAYDASAERAGFSALDRLERLAEQIGESSCVSRGGIYVDGFSDFTALEMEVLSQLLRCGAELTVCLTADSLSGSSEEYAVTRAAAGRLMEEAARRGAEVREEHPDIGGASRDPELEYLSAGLLDYGAEPYGTAAAVTLREASEPLEECEFAAAEILRWASEGLRWRDMAVTARGFERYRCLLEDVFERYGIPLFVSFREDILNRPAVRFLLGALETVSFGWEAESMLGYLKSGFAGLELEEIDRLENYIYMWNLRGQSRWTGGDWSMNPRGMDTMTEEDAELLAEFNGMRRRAADPLQALSEGLKNAGTAGGKTRALYAFMENVGLAAALEERARAFRESGREAEAMECEQLWDIIVGALEQTEAVSGGVVLDDRAFQKLMSLMLSQYSVATIPPSIDSVAAGDMQDMHRRSMKRLVIIGADDESLPMGASPDGIFSDGERELLRELGVAVHGGAGERLCRELYTVCSAAARPEEALAVSYSASAGPSFLVKRIRRLFDGAEDTRGREELATWAPSPCFELAALGGSPTAFAARECMSAMPEWSGRLREAEAAAEMGGRRLARDSVEKMFGKQFSMSASRVESYNTCRFAYFLRYGLKAKPRRRAQLDAPQAGTFVHFLLENLAREAERAGGFANTDDEFCRRTVRRCMDVYASERLGGLENKSERFRWLFRRLASYAERVAVDMAGELRRSDFKPLDFELSFRDGGDAEPIELQSPEGGMRLTGLVDRVDGYVHGDKLYIRVTDYKTGVKTFSLSDIWYGMGMQMLIYLFALQEAGEKRYGMPVEPAGVLYMPAREVILKLPRDAGEDEINEARNKTKRRSGLLLCDPDIIEAMERGEDKQYIPVKIKNGALSGAVATAEQFGMLAGHVFKLLGQLERELRDGDISAAPYVSGGRPVCEWCEYRAACQFDETRSDRQRKLSRISDSGVWKLIREGEEDG